VDPPLLLAYSSAVHTMFSQRWMLPVLLSLAGVGFARPTTRNVTSNDGSFMPIVAEMFGLVPRQEAPEIPRSVMKASIRSCLREWWLTGFAGDYGPSEQGWKYIRCRSVHTG
jgi:hypothetical protein